MMNTDHKRRRRTPLSCVYCRQKKIRCDRSKPTCGKCKQLKIKCEYTSPTLWSEIKEQAFLKDEKSNLVFVASLDNDANTDVTETEVLSHDKKKGKQYLWSTERKLQEIEKLQKQIKEIEDCFNPDIDCISLVLDGENKSLINVMGKKNGRYMSPGTFMLSSVWRRDALMSNFVKTYLIIKKKVREFNQPQVKTNFVEKYIPKSDTKVLDMKCFEFLNNQLKMKKKGKKVIDSSTVLHEIDLKLPPMDIINFYVDYFMKFIHPFIPIFDEYALKDNIVALLVADPLTNAVNSRTNSKSKIDAIRLATILLIIRISYLSLFIEYKLTKKTPADDVQRVLSFEINSDIIVLIHSALNSVNFLRKTSIEIFQLILLLKFYQINSCEDGDGYFGADGAIYMGIVKSMVQVLGVDKKLESSSIDTKCGREINYADKYTISPSMPLDSMKRDVGPFQQLWKKLWWISLALDISQSTSIGSSTLLDHTPNFGSNVLPVYQPEFSNVHDIGLERVSIDNLEDFSKINCKVARLINQLHSFEKKPTVTQIERLIAEIEDEQRKTYIEVNSRIYKNKSLMISANVNFIKARMETSCCLVMVQYDLLLHYEHLAKLQGVAKEVGHQKFKKLFPETLSKWIEFSNDILLVWEKISYHRFSGTSHSDDMEYSSYVMILIPVMNKCFSKLMLGLFYLSIRLLTFNYKVETNKLGNNFHKIDALKVHEFSKLYQHLLLLMKAVILIQEKLSKYWYVSLRNFAMCKKLVDWFVNGGKFTLDYASSNLYADSVEPTDPYDIGKISDDAKNYETIGMLGDLLLDLDVLVLENLNLKFEVIVKTYSLDNLNSKKKQNSVEIQKSRDEVDVYGSASLKEDVGNAGSPGLNEASDFFNNLTSDKSTSDYSDITDFIYFEPTELNDWDAVSRWFDQVSVLDSIDLPFE